MLWSFAVVLVISFCMCVFLLKDEYPRINYGLLNICLSFLLGCGATISAPSGDIYSPNFPNKYNSNLDCIWILEVSQDKISIGFNEFELEDYAFCQADYLEIRDGDSESSPLLGRFCGSNGPMIQYGTTNKLWVKFHTDGKIQKTGFEATWTKMKQTHMFPSEKVVDEESKPYPSPSSKS